MATIQHSITSSPLFRHCTVSQRRRLEQLSTPVQVTAGYQLTHEGATGHEFGVLLEGTATVSVHGQPIASLGPGDHYGEIALLADVGHDGRRTATVTADTDLWVAVLSIPEFRTVRAEFPDVAEAIHRAAEERAAATSA